MKKTNVLLFLFIAGLAVVAAGCNNNTYSRLRAEEDKLITNYLNRNQIRIHTTLPADDQWGEKDYYKVPAYDNLYFHLIHRGDSVWYDEDSIPQDLQIIANDLIVVRYKKFDLTEYPDTISYWSTLDQPYPYEFHYGNTNDCEAVGWHEAVKLMKYPDSQCEMIVPSKMGFTDDQYSVTPYVYILKIEVKP